MICFKCGKDVKLGLYQHFYHYHLDYHFSSLLKGQNKHCFCGVHLSTLWMFQDHILASPQGDLETHWLISTLKGDKC